jgi:hypothetical protein
MRQFIRNAAVVVVVLALAGAAFAGGKSGPKSGGSSGNRGNSGSGGNSNIRHHSSSPSMKSHNSSNKYSFNKSKHRCYRYGYSGWSSTMYSSDYECNLYYDPSACEWYFWSGAQSCYMPVSAWSNEDDDDD